jgi:hypothetical protein
MASAIDDLRYISRYGYRDPWAEATKNITDSLLAYGKSKLQRDMLIAKVEQDKQDMIAKQERERKQENRYTFGMLENVQDRLDFTNNPQVAMDVFGPDGAAAGRTNLERKDSIQKQLKSYEDIAKDPNSTFIDTKNALTEAKILSTKEEVGNPTAYNYMIQRAQNKFLNESNKQFLTEFAESGYDVVTDKGKWLTKAEYTNIMEDIDEGRLPQAQTILNRLFSQKGTDLRFIKTMYAQHIASYDTAFKDDDGMWIDNNSAEQYSLLRESLDKRVMKMLPTKYQNWKNPVQQNIEDAILRLDDKDDDTDENRLDINDKKLTSTVQSNLNVITNENPIYSDDAKVAITVQSGSGEMTQVVSGAQANQLIQSNRGRVSTSPESIKRSYVPIKEFTQPQPFQTTIGSGRPEEDLYRQAGYTKQDETRQIAPIKSGDDVIDIKTGASYKVTIKKVDNPRRVWGRDTRMRFGMGRYLSMDSIVQVPYKYIVDGKSYTLQQFSSKFGVPLYQEAEVDSGQGTTDTGFSTRLKASSVKRN